MKHGIQILILLVVLTGLTNCKKSEVDISYDKKYVKEIKSFRNEIAFYLSRNFAPGGNFAVMKDERIIYSEGMGLASTDLEVPATRKTKFRIGKVSELFTSLIYQMMIEEGVLHPDSTVQHYLPDFPATKYPITIDNLVNHTAGIRPPYESEKDLSQPNVSLQKGLDLFKNDPQSSPPGWYQIQSMYNYNLLGVIMEKVSGKKYPKLLKEYITDTLHLTNTVVDNPFNTIIGRSDFYDHNLVAQVTYARFYDSRYRAPSDGILSTAEDLAKFGNAILNSDLISDKIRNRLFVPVSLGGDIPASMANGWMILDNEEGKQFYGRTGGVLGGGASILIYPNYNLVVAGAVNLSSAADEIPVFHMSAPFLPNYKPKEETK